MLKELLNECEGKMKITLELLRKDYSTLRAGRANPSILDRITVEYYGTPTPLVQMANISAPEPRLLLIQPWDKTSISNIEKAIQKSDLGINPSNDGSVIRIAIPQLTEERRQELVKVVHKKAEEARVSTRNVRRDYNDKVKAQEKAKEITEDEAKKCLDDIQKMTDKYIKEIDRVADLKEKEIMEV